MNKKEETRKLIKGCINFVGGICTSNYAYALLTTVCPPVGIVAGVGCGLLSGAIGDVGGNKAEKIVDATYELIDKWKKDKKSDEPELEVVEN